MLIDICCYLSDRIRVGVRGGLATLINNPLMAILGEKPISILVCRR